MPIVTTPYPAFSYCVELVERTGTKALGGFFQVSGVPSQTSLTGPVFRGDPGLAPIKVSGARNVGDVV